MIFFLGGWGDFLFSYLLFLFLLGLVCFSFSFGFFLKCGDLTMSAKKIICKDTKEVAKKYSEYLLTNHWKAKRIEVAQRENYICEMCGCKVDVGFHIHHKTYKNLGNERSKDLMFLCEKCHTELHISLRAKKNNIKKKKDNRKACNNCYFSQIMLFKSKNSKGVLWCNKKCTTCDWGICSFYRKG